MTKIHIGIKYLLDNETESFYKTENSIYSKVKISDDLIILYRTPFVRNNSTEVYSIQNMTPKMVGVYSIIKEKILLLFDDNYGASEVLLGKEDFYEELKYDTVIRKFNTMLKDEILSIFNLSKANKNFDYWSELKNSIIFGLEYQMKYNLTGYETKVTIENLEDFLCNTEDYAFEIAENFVNENQELVSKYIKAQDIETVKEEFKIHSPIQWLLRDKITAIQEQYKTVTLYLLDENDNEIIISSFPSKNIETYPIYKIQKILYRKQEIFNINDFDSYDVKSLSTDRFYNLYCLRQLHGIYNGTEKEVCYDNFFKFLSKDLLNDKEFVSLVLKYNISLCKFLPETMLSDISLIEDYLKKDSGNKDYKLLNVIKFVDKPTFEHYKDEILSGLSSNLSYMKNLQKFVDYQLFKELANLYNVHSLPALTEDLAKDLDIQIFINNFFKNYYTEFRNTLLVNLSLIKNKDIVFNLITVNNLKTLSDDLKSDLDFALRVLEKAKKYGVKDFYFEEFYHTFVGLQNNEDFILNLSKICKLTDMSIFEAFSQDMKDKCIEDLALNNFEFAKFCDDDVKLRLLKKDLMYLKYFSTEYEWDEHWILTAANLSNNHHDIYYKGGRVFDNLHKHTKKDVIIKVLKINPNLLRIINSDIAEDYEIAYELTKTMSIIPFIKTYYEYEDEKNRLFLNKEIMLRCIRHNPSDFKLIPKSTSIYKALVLEDREFIKEAFTLDYKNANLAETPLKRDASLLKELMIEKHFETYVGFQVTLLRDESLITEILDTLISKYGQDADWSDIVSRVKNTFMKRVPKKITESSSFKTKYSQFC